MSVNYADQTIGPITVTMVMRPECSMETRFCSDAMQGMLGGRHQVSSVSRSTISTNSISSAADPPITPFAAITILVHALICAKVDYASVAYIHVGISLKMHLSFKLSSILLPASWGHCKVLPYLFFYRKLPPLASHSLAHPIQGLLPHGNCPTGSVLS